MIVLSNGDLVVGGSFTVAGSVRAYSVARFSGGNWSAIGGGLRNGEVCALAQLPDGSIVAAGRFQTSVTLPPVLLARWNGTSWLSLDADVLANSSSNRRLRALAVLPGGDLVVGGDSFDLAETPDVLVARKSDAGWTPLAFGGGSVRSILALSPSDLVVGGEFTLTDPEQGVVFGTNLARLSGGNWSQLGPVLNGKVNALAIGQGGSLVVGGEFTAAGSSPLSSLAVLNNNAWSSIGDIAGGRVGSVVRLSSGKFAAVGHIARLNSTTSSRLVVWDGTTLERITGGFISYSVNAVVELPDGKLAVGGSFAQRGEPLTLNVSAWNGQSWSAFGQGRGVAISAMRTGRDGRVVIGGSSSPTVPAVPFSTRISLWNRGTLASFPLLPGSLIALDRRENGEIIAGGSFSNLPGQAPFNGGQLIARWDGTAWQPMGTVEGTLSDILVTRTNEVLIAGQFSDQTGLGTNTVDGSVARWNGSQWELLGALRSGFVGKLLEREDGRVVAVGNFESPYLSDLPPASIAEWDGSTWTYAAPQIGGAVFDAAILRNGDIVVGGVFDEISGVAAQNIAKWNGSEWSALGAGSSAWVNAVTVRPNGDIIASGFFRTSPSSAISSIARWDGTRWNSLGFGDNRPITSLVTLPSGDVLAGGVFSAAFPTFVSPGLAHYSFGQPAIAIDTQPAALVACEGSDARMTIKLSDGVGAVYQWRKNGAAIDASTNSTATSRTLVLAQVTGTDAGSYDCVVTNPCGSVVSSAAELSVPVGCSLADVSGQGSRCPDGALTADDIITFLGWYFAGNWRADVAGANQSTIADGTINADDIIVFVSRFFAGCD